MTLTYIKASLRIKHDTLCFFFGTFFSASLSLCRFKKQFAGYPTGFSTVHESYGALEGRNSAGHGPIESRHDT